MCIHVGLNNTLPAIPEKVRNQRDAKLKKGGSLFGCLNYCRTTMGQVCAPSLSLATFGYNSPLCRRLPTTTTTTTPPPPPPSRPFLIASLRVFLRCVPAWHVARWGGAVVVSICFEFALEASR